MGSTGFGTPVNGKGGDGKAGSNNAGEVKDVDGWDGIQRGGKKGPDTKFDADYVPPVMPKGPDTKFDADYVAPVMPKGPDTKFDADYVAPVNGKGGDGKAGSNNAGEVKDVDGWDGIQRGGKKGGTTAAVVEGAAIAKGADDGTDGTPAADIEGAAIAKGADGTDGTPDGADAATMA